MPFRTLESPVYLERGGGFLGDMKNYEVSLSVSFEKTIKIEAESESEARKKAEFRVFDEYDESLSVMYSKRRGVTVGVDDIEEI